MAIDPARFPADDAQSLIADIPTPAMPAWSPDGTRLAYLWDAGAGWELWVVGRAGDGARRLSTGAVLTQVDWSPDGVQVVFTQRVEGGSAIAVAAADSGSVRRLTDGPRDRSPQWSPDGTTISCISGRAGQLD